MEITQQTSFNLIANHKLWVDGTITVETLDNLLNLIQRGVSVDRLFVEQTTPEIQQYNNLVSSNQKLTKKQSVAPLNYNWNIPAEYLDFDVMNHLVNKLEEEYDIESSEFEDRFKRICEELVIFKRNNINHILNVIIYIINTLEENNVVWGVGRGSSVSSYVLYLIGVHDVDSVKYKLSITDFML